MSVFRDLLMIMKGKEKEDTRLLYLQSTGTQYIDTGIKLNYNSKFDLKYELPTKNSNSEFFGFGDYRSTSYDNACHVNIFTASGGIYYLYNSLDWTNWRGATSQTFPLQIVLQVRENIAYLKDFSLNTTYFTKNQPIRSNEDYSSALLFASKYYEQTDQPFNIVKGAVKIYEYTIYNPANINEVIHHFIPVLHNDIPCMKDEITGEYYYNIGTGDFLYEEYPPLPNEYQYVEYIESDGNQYIDTGISGSDLGEYEIKMNPLSTTARQWEQYFGGQLYTETTVGKLYENSGRLVYQGYPLARNQYVGISSLMDAPFEIQVIDGGVYSNGTKLSNYTPVAWGTPSFYIFDSHSEPTLGASMKLYYLKMYSNGTLVRDYIPCYRKADNVIGLYDLVSKTFFTNEGTGTFSKGANV